jgi:hypothetical protein
MRAIISTCWNELTTFWSLGKRTLIIENTKKSSEEKESSGRLAHSLRKSTTNRNICKGNFVNNFEEIEEREQLKICSIGRKSRITKG